MSNIAEIIRAENNARLENIAISERGREVTYGELLAMADEIAQELGGNGVAACDRVALLYDDGIDYVALSLAILSARAVLVPISPTFSFDEVDEVLERIDVAWLISACGVPMPEGTLPPRTVTCDRLSGQGFQIAGRHVRSKPPEAYRACNPAFVRFSSGTTGASKGVVLSHEAIVERTDAADRTLAITPADTVLWLLSMTFHFVVTILLFLRRGAKLVICSGRFPDELLEVLSAERGTFMYASPFHYRLLASSEAFTPEIFASVRMAVSTATALLPDIAADFAGKFGLHLSQAYGIIEVGLPFIQPASAISGAGSVGTIGPGYEIKLIKPEDGVGEVLIRGRGMFSAYFSPWRRREDLDPGGWFHTGDLGRLDSEGRLFIVGRKQGVINFAGMKIFPVEVEAVLNQHPAVAESLVYGVESTTYGQIPAAKVVLRVPETEETTIRHFCYDRLPAYKVPKTITIVERLEKTASGKIRRARTGE